MTALAGGRHLTGKLRVGPYVHLTRHHHGMLEALELADQLVFAAEDVGVEGVREEDVVILILDVADGLQDFLQLPAVAYV